MTIKNRISLSFLVLVTLFGVYSVITIITLNDNKALSIRVSEVIDPLLQRNSDFNNLLIESKMYTTNWVFLGSKQEDKIALIDLHKNRYPQLKQKSLELAFRTSNAALIDSLYMQFASFEQLINIEKQIMNNLAVADDYNDAAKKLLAKILLKRKYLSVRICSCLCMNV